MERVFITECDVRRVYVLVHGCVCASHADEMKNGGRLKFMCQQTRPPEPGRLGRLWPLHFLRVHL